MPRKCRFLLPGVPQHVIQRGNNREPCFYAEMDYRRYLDDLLGSCEKYACTIHAYVLMTNHVHLLISSSETFGISQMMQALGRRYVCYINRRYRRTGTLWEGRFKATLIDTEAYLLTCMRYIESNPVRAAMVTHPSEYRWSSYAANAQGVTDALVTPHPIYLALDTSPSGRQQAYRELFRQSIDEDQLHDIREALNHELVLGRPHFKDKVEAMTARQTRPGSPGRPRVEEGRAMYEVPERGVY
jgi:putative transposase